jgi:probable HAF family extracellular repeat protein
MSRFRTSHLVSLTVLALAAALPATAAAAPATAAAKTYTITDMGSLGLGESVPYGINANGQVTGLSYLSSTYKFSCGYPIRTCTAHPYHAFLYGNGTMTDLGTLGGTNSQGNAVNLSGQVAGVANTNKGGTDATLWTGKKATDLGALAPLAGSYSVAYGISDSGQVVGSWAAGVTAINDGSHPFLYSNGTITSLPEPSNFTAAGCEARAINNNGQIAGMCTDTNGNAHLVMWQNGTVTDLGTIGNDDLADLEALAMNNNGQIAGWTAATTTGFFYSNGTITHLSGFFPNAINDNGVMSAGPRSIAAGPCRTSTASSRLNPATRSPTRPGSTTTARSSHTPPTALPAMPPCC